VDDGGTIQVGPRWMCGGTLGGWVEELFRQLLIGGWVEELFG